MSILSLFDPDRQVLAGPRPESHDFWSGFPTEPDFAPDEVSRAFELDPLDAAYGLGFACGSEGSSTWIDRWYTAEGQTECRAFHAGLMAGNLHRARLIGTSYGEAGRSADAAFEACMSPVPSFPNESARACQQAWEAADAERRSEESALLDWIADREANLEWVAREWNLPGEGRSPSYEETVEACGVDVARCR